MIIYASALAAFMFAHIAGFMAYLIFIPEATLKSKLFLAFFWEFVAWWDFCYPIYEDSMNDR